MFFSRNRFKQGDLVYINQHFYISLEEYDCRKVSNIKDSILTLRHLKAGNVKYFFKKTLQEVEWDRVSWEQKLSEQFIEHFKTQLSWFAISYQQNLSEDFIASHQDYVNWNNIFWGQNLTDDFFLRFPDKYKQFQHFNKSHNYILREGK